MYFGKIAYQRVLYVTHMPFFNPQVRGQLQLFGPGGCVVGTHQQPPVSILPQTNLPQNLPLVQDLPPQNFSTKDQHLLKPPPCMGTGSGLGRRASDGGANLQMYFQRQFEGGWSHPNSQEQITQMGLGVRGMGGHSQPLPQQEDEQIVVHKDEIDPLDVAKYMSSRGGSHRATLPLVGLKDAQEAQRKMTPSRSRRSGLLTVTERPPVITPELRMEVEERMKRPYVPSHHQALYSNASMGNTQLNPSQVTGGITTGIPPSPSANATITPGIVSGIPHPHTPKDLQ
ncbi:serine/threonine-protein kinase SIK3-like, partial [Penaeus monodon]|uniref:serine/threonine-protein kinase SIK3-like n=1 Tax=Penaeus monodon TaxID=6687 RepID=UPI0018A7352F